MKSFKELKLHIDSQRGLPHIMCDLDGVLVDFVKGADAQLVSEGEPHFFDNHWHDHEEVVRWDILDRNPNFWNELPVIEDGLKLWEYIKPYQPSILSAMTPHSKNVKRGKQLWVENHLDIREIFEVNLVGLHDKHLYALNKITGSPNLLIDDWEKNIIRFREAGGIAIHHTSLEKTLDELKNMGY